MAHLKKLWEVPLKLWLIFALSVCLSPPLCCVSYTFLSLFVDVLLFSLFSFVCGLPFSSAVLLHKVERSWYWVQSKAARPDLR